MLFMNNCLQDILNSSLTALLTALLLHIVSILLTYYYYYHSNYPALLYSLLSIAHLLKWINFSLCLKTGC